MTGLLARHLLDSTCFALVVALLVRALPAAAPASRHRLLLAAAAKFALPLSGCFALGAALRSLLSVHTAASPPGVLLYTVRVSASSRPAGDSAWQTALLTLWLGGAAVLLLRWCWQLRRSSAALPRATGDALAALQRASQRLALRRAVSLRVSADTSSPYLAGVRRPTIVLPDTLFARLSPPEFEAILLHELAHVRRHDNLVLGCIHVLTCLFWFHPLLWWLERAIRAEGESACDELVLAAGIAPRDYVQGICKTCRLALLHPLPGRSYVSASPLTHRLERIMSNPHFRRTPLLLRLASVAALPLLLLVTVVTGASTGDPSLASDSSAATSGAADITCAIAGVHLPLGTAVRPGKLSQVLVCTRRNGVVTWVASTEATRDRNKPVIQVDDAPPISCTATAPVGDLCTCSNLRFSPGAVVDSPAGALVCPKTGGTWRPYRSTPRAAAEAPQVYKPGDGVTAPVLTYTVDPEYSEIARKQKISATPLVSLVVGNDGLPTDVHLLRSAAEGRSGEAAAAASTLDDQALRTVRQYRFQPGLRDGQPVPVELKVEVNFQIF